MKRGAMGVTAVLLSIAAAVLLSVSLTGCGQTVDDVKREGAFAKVCHDQGGRVFYDGGNSIRCSFDD